MMLKKMVAVLGVALCLTMGLTALASAQDYKKFAVGIRGVYVLTDDKLDSRLAGVHVNNDQVPGVDVEYFFTKNVSSELFAAVTHHDIKAGGNIIGSLYLLPPTLTVKYHPLAGQAVSPYVGGGVNFTMPFNTRVNGASDFTVNNHVGWVAQAGADFNINPSLFFNLDYKFVGLNTHLHLGGDKFKVDVNPHLIGVGFGYRF